MTLRMWFVLFAAILALGLAWRLGLIPVGKPDVTITIEKMEPDIREAAVKANRKQSVAWKGKDNAYRLYFKHDAWAFKEAPDAEDADYKYILVPKGGTSDSFSLDYELSSGERREHHYLVGADPPSGPLPPPNGPVIVGEG